MKELWQIDVGYFCAGLETENGKVTYTAPILNWTLGKSLTSVQNWVAKKNGSMIKIW